ncbi:uncharacterized protein LOC119294481 [Triticum dicoccoides]|uniref:uncharacterized protein LOC119294481 n=1 Tax=Triticum dicoccoides TaxID=85692 RepID=UPI0018904D55|nr:uncharacterized protein LOC119294481 [Triticum dicoccoides]
MVAVERHPFKEGVRHKPRASTRGPLGWPASASVVISDFTQQFYCPNPILHPLRWLKASAHTGAPHPMDCFGAGPINYTGEPNRRFWEASWSQPTAARTTVREDEHKCTPPAPTYADVVRANVTPSPTDGHNRTPTCSLLTNVAGTSATNITGARRPLLQSFEISNYSSEEDAFSLALLHAARRIPADSNFEKLEVPIITEICLNYIGRPRSIQNLTSFLKNNPLAQRMDIFEGKMTVLTATLEGRILMQTFMNVVSECHSRNKSWNGTFDWQDIRIITTRQSKKIMMILKVPVKLEGETLLRAMRSDLCKAAAILIPLYKIGPFPNDWRTVVKSEMKSNTAIAVFTVVYYHKPGTSYGRTMGELARFIRNVLVHSKEHRRQDGVVIYYEEHELEMYLFKIFTPFLPSVMRTLLVSGKMDMEQLCGEEAWTSYKLFV